MSTSADRTSRSRAAAEPRLAVDRVACSGHGICAQLLSGVRLDEWGYPVVDAERVARADGPDAVATAVRLCPALALYLR